MLLLVFAFALSIPRAVALTNGLASRPFMGWAIWYSPYQWAYNWDFYLSNQVSAAHTNGVQSAGYQYFEVDDCWWTNRDAGGHIVPAGFKWPEGVKSITNTINYVHSLGLKFGIYDIGGDVGGACGYLGQTGAHGRETQDATDFAAWGVDFVKYDVSWTPDPLEDPISAFTRAVLATGRPMIITSGKGTGMLDWYPNYMNSARFALDSNGVWENVLAAIDADADLARYAGPEYWNDPDYLLIGLDLMFGLPIQTTRTQQESQFAMWCILAAPLMLSCDLTIISPETLAVVTNPEMIAIDQDDGCRQGLRISQTPGIGGNLEVWSKPLGQEGASNAVALFNRSSQPARISVTQQELGMGSEPIVTVRDAWNRQDAGTFSGSFGATVEPHATAVYVLTGGAAPKLQISLVAGQAVLSWPTNAAGLTLEVCNGLSPSSSWEEVALPPTVIGSKFVLTTSIDSSPRFFRLHQQ